MPQRDEVLTDELVRPKVLGLRPFSVGILALCRKLELSFALPVSQRREVSQDEARLQELALVWLLDERQSLEQIKARAALGFAGLRQTLEAYEFEVSPALFAEAKAELTRTNEALQMALVHVQPQPQPGGKSPTPPGN